MANILIRELPLYDYRFSIVGEPWYYDNRRNDMTVDGKRSPGFPFAHFKTSEGASIFDDQNVQPTEITIIDVDGNEYNPTDFDQLKGYLHDINFFAWQSNYGGGGGGGVDRFDQLTDTFSYPGKQLMFPRVNASETGLEAVSLLVHDRITQHVDWGGTNPLQVIDNGRRVIQAMVGGVPKLIMADDTANSPIPPNALLTDFTPTNVGDDWTILANRLWRIDGILYSNGLDFDFEVVPAVDNKIRQDIVYVTSDNELHYVVGVEGDIAAPIPQTGAPANSLVAVTFTVTEDSTTVTPSPVGAFVTKESYIQSDIYATGTYALPLLNRTRFNIYAPATITGFEDNSDAPDYDLNYDGQMFWIRNAGGDEVTLQHEGAGPIPFWFYDGVDHPMPVDGRIWQFKLTKAANRLEFVGYLGGESGNFIPLSGTVDGSPLTGSIVTNISFPLSSSENVFIVGTAEDADLDEGAGGSTLQLRRGTAQSATLFATDIDKNEVSRLDVILDNDTPSNSKVIVDISGDGSPGLSGAHDYTPNITDLDYPQKKYVDEAIAAAGGSATLQSVTDEGAVTTNTITIVDGSVLLVRDAEGNNASSVSQASVESLDNVLNSGSILKNNGTIELRNGISQQHISSLASTERFNALPDEDGTLTLSVSVNAGTKVFADDSGNINITVAGGSGVDTVTGNLVDNTDPQNPVVTGVETVTGTAVTGTSTNPIINTPVVTLGQVQSGMGYSIQTNTDPIGITLLPALSTPNVRDGIMSGSDKVALDSAKAVNGLVTSNGSGSFTAATTSGSGSVVALQTSPGLLGAPTAPTAALYTNTTQLANTSFVNRAIIGSRARIISDYNLPTVAANTPTKIFNIGVSNNGTWNLPEGEYEFFLQLNVSGLPATATNISYISIGTAVVSNVYMDASTAKSTSDVTGTNTMSFGIFSTAATPISTSNTATFVRSQITGTFTVTTGGTYIPQIQGSIGFTTAVIRQGTRCVIRRIGDVGTYYTSDVD